jgi:transcription elongation factor GreA
MIEAIRKKLSAEVEALNHELSVTLPEALKKAIQQGDLRENGDYHAALERQAFVQSRISQLRSRLGKLSSIDPAKIPPDRVGLGSRVVVKDAETKHQETYELVIPESMDFEGGQISVSSPLGRALLEKKKGETVTVHLPGGTRKLKIVELHTFHDLVSD